MRKSNRRTTTRSCRSPTDRKNAAVIVPAQRPCTQVRYNWCYDFMSYLQVGCDAVRLWQAGFPRATGYRWRALDLQVSTQ